MPTLAQLAFGPNVSGAIQRGLQGRSTLNQNRQQDRALRTSEAIDTAVINGVPADPAARAAAEAEAFRTGGAQAGLGVREVFTRMTAPEREQLAQEGRRVATVLAGVQDQGTYDQARVGLQGMGIDVSKLPEQFDPAVRDFYVNSQRELEDVIKAQQPANPVSLGPNAVLIDPATGREIANNRPQGGVGGGPFQGTGVSQQAMNVLLDPNANPASPIYAVAYNQLYGPRVQQITQPDGSTVLAEITPRPPVGIRPPIAAAQAGPTPAAGAPPTPTAGSSPSSQVNPIAGTQRARQFNQDQTKAAGFANRAMNSAGLAATLEQKFDPTAITEQRGNLPIIGNLLATEEFQRYERAKLDFITAVLRRESGAAISETEFDTEDAKFFPQPGDTQQVIVDKRNARDRAIQNLIADSQGAFQALFPQLSSAVPVTSVPPAASAATPASPSASNIQPAIENMPRPTTQEGYDALPDGAWYVDPDTGSPARKGR